MTRSSVAWSTELPAISRRLLAQLQEGAPFQPATNFWRAIELPALAARLPTAGHGLDVGCGDGVLTGILRELVAAKWTLVGLDPDPQETALAERTGLYQQVFTCGADQIAVAAETFDFAFANSVLEHIPNLPACLVEIGRVLKPGGEFLATVPSALFHDCLQRGGRQPEARERYLKELDVRLAHLQYWSEDRWRTELAQAGIEVQTFEPYLSASQVRHWEWLSHWTGGLLYRLRGKKQRPIEIQRSLRIRRGLPRCLRWLGSWTAALVGGRRLDAPSPPVETQGGLLIVGKKLSS